MDYVLGMGDQVEVITSTFQNPQEQHFDYLVTSLAKSRLKAGIKDYKRTFKEKGKALLQEYFLSLDIDFSRQNRNLLAERAGLAGRIDLYYNVALEKVVFEDVENLLKNHQEESLNSLLRILSDSEETKNKEKESNDLGYTISNCCNPIPGDDVVAISFPNQPLQIHRPDCPKAISLMSQFGNNIVKAKWHFSDDLAFMATLKISAVNKMGFGSELFAMLSGKFKLDLYSVKMQSEGGMVDATVSFYVNNLKQLETVISDIESMNLVNRVKRMERNAES